MLRTTRAFTLLELLVATTVASVVVAAASTAVFLILRALTRTEQSGAANAEAQLVTEYLTSQLQGIGGGAVRPWMAFTMQNNRGDGGTEVVTFADVPGTLPLSATITQSLGDGRFSFFLFTDQAPGRCALADLRKDTNGDGFPEPVSDRAAAYTPGELSGSEVILTSPTGETWRSVVVKNVGMTLSVNGCFAEFDDDDEGLVANGALREADRFDRDPLNDNVEVADQWVLGQMSFVRARTWRVSDGRIVETLAVRGRPVEQVLFEGALDLQVAVGFDFSPVDGVIGETPTGSNDEWLMNGVQEGVALEQLPRDLQTAFSPPVPVDAMRQIAVDVVVALPRGERVLEVRAFDGEARRGVEARVARSRAYLRNLLLFL
jgi:prepilin-type N-terminal cleavage/methylation domain-containing protein